ncbi:ATP-binding protein [Kitasatospora sp. NPDC088346]|uniref:ATP-binding protein n=1 Tax=Kitasatospora sp. NPDC088346 TaxID=3364073 RepID=UPI00380397AD
MAIASLPFGTAAPDDSPAAVPPPGHRVSATRGATAEPAAVPALRHFAGETARQWRVPAEAVRRLELVVSELVTNVVLHSRSADVSVSVELDGAALTVEVQDSGTWRNRWAAPPSGEDRAPTGGHGLEVVRHHCLWWLAFPSPAGTRVVASLSAGPGTE